MWNSPIIDRNSSDIYSVNRSGLADCKGAFNASDLNRIEENVQYLAEQLETYGYYVPVNVKTDWVLTDWPAKAQLDRIRSNIQSLLIGFYTMDGSPEMIFVNTLTWDDANDLEQNLYNMKILLERLIDGFRHCGGFNFYSGSEVVLP